MHSSMCTLEHKTIHRSAQYKENLQESLRYPGDNGATEGFVVLGHVPMCEPEKGSGPFRINCKPIC